LGPFGETKAGLEAKPETVNQGRDEPVGACGLGLGPIPEGNKLHSRRVRFASGSDCLVALQIFVDGRQVGAKGAVRRGDTAKVLERKQSNETGDSKNILLDRVQLETLAEQTVAETEVDGIEGKLDLRALLGQLFKE